MASKEEILRTVLTALDRLTAIETQLDRLEHPVPLTAKPQPKSIKPEKMCDKCLHPDGESDFGKGFCAFKGCICLGSFHRNKTPNGCPSCGHACGVWGTGIICADVSKFNSSLEKGPLDRECRCTNPYHKAYKSPLTD